MSTESTLPPSLLSLKWTVCTFSSKRKFLSKYLSELTFDSVMAKEKQPFEETVDVDNVQYKEDLEFGDKSFLTTTGLQPSEYGIELARAAHQEMKRK